jgi:hypothetical protein
VARQARGPSPDPLRYGCADPQGSVATAHWGREQEPERIEFDRVADVGHVCLVGSLIKRDELVARRKGWLASAATAGSLAFLVLGQPWLAVVGLAGSAYLGYDWFSFRAKRGMRL